MSQYVIAYSQVGKKWEILSKGFLDDASTKKSAIKKAKGLAQEEADRKQRRQIIEVYDKNDTYQRKIKVSPAP